MEHIRRLFQLYVNDQATDEQVKELFLFLQHPDNDAFSRELFAGQMSEDVSENVSDSQEKVWENIRRKRRKPLAIVMRWVAAAALLAAISTLLIIKKTPVEKQEIVMDMPAAGNKAILTLSDGSSITLDSAGNGTIARQGNVAIVKSANGAIRYDAEGDHSDAVMMNKITTPMGGQYQLVLPDGTKVWLNAASSISYPAYFTGNERQVTVTGEVYLEVAKDMTHPFIAAITGHKGIEVLGTGFNINAYGDEGKIITTLIEGRIRMSGSNVILNPGQQAVESVNGQLSVIGEANTEKETAWKNGIFYFEDASLPLVMKQLERWYDITVVYEGAVPELRINGKMDRNLTLQGVMDFLTKMGVNYTMKSRTIMVREK